MNPTSHSLLALPQPLNPTNALDYKQTYSLKSPWTGKLQRWVKTVVFIICPIFWSSLTNSGSQRDCLCLFCSFLPSFLTSTLPSFQTDWTTYHSIMDIYSENVNQDIIVKFPSLREKICYSNMLQEYIIKFT